MARALLGDPSLGLLLLGSFFDLLLQGSKHGITVGSSEICILRGEQDCGDKALVAFSLLRLSGPMNVWWTRIIWGLVLFICFYMIESWVSILAFCNPVAAHWDKKILKTAKCWPPEVFRIFPLVNTGCNIFTDVCFATLPILIIWRLQMKRRTRLYLIGVFSFGYIAVAIGIAKAISQVRFRGDPDAVFHNWTQTLGFLQQNVGVVAACAPSLRPLVGRWLKLSDSTKDSHYKNGYEK
ncbi:hypothetical protein B0T16DRAFT_459328 [Cercophora newfieldiana]|uniref:Rhodopsin domain-containing protein n=1 Tax=Cercophora newfieldiana TaxID=92897 RepID=A0AA39XZI2_9PEZI|nr:hypothetical protein B0T16DRAFT_459328 [Cercophora newfieldiana]